MVAAQAVEVDAAVALLLHQTVDFACKVGGNRRHPPAEHTVAGCIHHGDGRLAPTGQGEAAHKAVHRAVRHGAVVDVIALKGRVGLVQLGDLAKVGGGLIHRAADQSAHGGDVCVIGVAAALVVLDAGPGVGVDADDDDPFCRDAVGFRMAEDFRAHGFAQAQQIAGDDELPCAFVFNHDRAGIEGVADAQRAAAQIVAIARQLNAHGRGEFPFAKSGTHRMRLLCT